MEIMKRGIHIVILSFKLLVALYFMIPLPSIALDFTLRGRRFEILEVDLGKQLGCYPEQITAVVLKNPENQQIWTTKLLEEAKRDYLFRGECVPAGEGSQVQGTWSQPDWVHFFVTSYYSGVHTCCETVTGYQFDGEKVRKVFNLPYTERVNIQLKPPLIIVAHYSVNPDECHACPHRWIRETFKWDGKTYQKIKTEISATKTQYSPWPN